MSDKKFLQELLSKRHQGSRTYPDREAGAEFIDRLFSFLFTASRSRHAETEVIENEYTGLKSTFASLLFDLLHDEAAVKEHSATFFLAIPGIYRLLIKDAETIARFDPAAQSIEEVLITYPGFYAIAIYRLAHQLYRQRISTLPRLFSEHAHGRTGIDIHPGAVIGASFFIDHGTGIVIGESTVIGNNVKLYQGVTLGALSVSKEEADVKRHPTIEDNVIIYSGASILGGDTVIGHDTVIGGNVWLTQSVVPYSVVYHKSEILVRDRSQLPKPLNFII